MYKNDILLKTCYNILRDENINKAIEYFSSYNYYEYDYYYDEKSYLQLKIASYKISYNEYLLFKLTNSRITIDGINLAIISDSEELINKYLASDFWSVNKGGKSNDAHNYIKTIQSIYKNDIDELEKQYNFFLNGKRVHKAYKGMPDFIRGILDKDNILIQKGIDTQLKNNSIIVYGETVNHISRFTIALIKVAKSKGFNVAEHPLVPNELIKIQPLDKYERYDFWKNIENGEPLKYIDPFEGQYDLSKKNEDVSIRNSSFFSILKNLFSRKK